MSHSHFPDVRSFETALGSMSADKRLILTWDQGNGMAHHDQVARLFSQRRVLRQPGLTVDAGHERKHCDGLLRQYLPEGTDLRVHDALDLGVIETTEHQTPQDLGGKTPAEVFGLAT